MSTQNEWGLTERGFRRPTYTELLDALEYKARELFGSKANLTVRSPIGLFLRIFAWILNMLFSTIEDVYNSRFVDTAVGTSLYNLGKAIGRDIVASCERLARGEGRGRVWCGVNAKALPVQQFFKARGYRSLGPAESEGGIERNELIFERML
mgnify:CR=1 FL=1